MCVDLRCLVGGVTGKGDAIGEVVAFFGRRLRSAADLLAQTEQHGQRPLAATTSTARGLELAGADSHMACAPTSMGGAGVRLCAPSGARDIVEVVCT